MGIVYSKSDRTFTIQTKNTTYQMQVDPYGFLLHLYYGKKTDGSCMDYLLLGAALAEGTAIFGFVVALLIILFLG